jgi:hypothetical protein
LLARKKCTNLAGGLVEVAVGEGLPDLLLEPPVWGRVGYVCLVVRATTTGEQGDDTASSVEDDGARISWGGEGATLLVVGQDGGVYGRVLDAIVGVDASERVKPVGTTYGWCP